MLGSILPNLTWSLDPTQESCTRPKTMSSGIELGVLNAIGASKSNVSVDIIEGHLATLLATLTSVVPLRNNRSSEPPPPQTPKQAAKERIQFLALCLSIFLVGWNDGMTSLLLPRVQSVYRVSYIIISLAFVFACTVSIVATSWSWAWFADWSIKSLGIHNGCAVACTIYREVWLWKGKSRQHRVGRTLMIESTVTSDR